MATAELDQSTPHLRLVADATDAPVGVAMLRAIIDASPDCIKIVEIDGTMSFMNENGCQAMEIDDWTAFRGRRWDTMWPASTQPDVLDAMAAARDGRATRFEAFCPTAKGSPRWWDVSVAPIKDEDGASRMVVTSRDVTERVNRENRMRLREIELNQLADEQAVLLRDQRASIDASDVLVREVDHRMKNSLAMLGSLLKMETRRTADGDAKATLKAAAARVATIASVHEQLYRGTERDALAVEPYLSALVRDLVSSMIAGPAGPQVMANVVADDVILRGGKALALGLATVEIVMNAIRHAERDGECRIEVECRREDESMRLSVRDEGPGLPAGFDPSQSRGLGMRVVQSSLAKLGGEMTWRDREAGGAEFTLVWVL